MPREHRFFATDTAGKSTGHDSRFRLPPATGKTFVGCASCGKCTVYTIRVNPENDASPPDRSDRLANALVGDVVSASRESLLKMIPFLHSRVVPTGLRLRSSARQQQTKRKGIQLFSLLSTLTCSSLLTLALQHQPSIVADTSHRRCRGTGTRLPFHGSVFQSMIRSRMPTDQQSASLSGPTQPAATRRTSRCNATNLKWLA